MQALTMTRCFAARYDHVAQVMLDHTADVLAGSSHHAVDLFTSSAVAALRAEGRVSPGMLPVSCDVTFVLVPPARAEHAAARAHAPGPGAADDRGARLRFAVGWHPASGTPLLPSMTGELLVSPTLLADEPAVQLRFTCAYQPPGGWPGRLADRMVGRHLTEATVHDWLCEVIERVTFHLAADHARPPARNPLP